MSFPGAGVIGDITTSEERGSLVEIFGGGEIIILFPFFTMGGKHIDEP